MEIFINFFDKYNPRLFDVFYTGPSRLYLSSFIKDKYLRKYILIEGILTILYNGYNYLRFQKGISLPIPFINDYTDKEKGKPQLHRLYNILVMYPLHLYIISKSDFTKFQLLLFLSITITGFIFNTYNYIHY